MKILFVRTICPNPIAYGSDMRSSRFVDFLSQIADMDFLTLTKPTELADQEYIDKNFKNFYYFDQKSVNSRLSSLEKLTALLPWQLTEYYSKDIQSRINKIVEENQYDFIFIFKLNPVLYFLRLPRRWHKKIIVDFDDMLSNLYLKHYKNFITAQKNSLSLWWYEREAMKHFSRVFVCSKDAVSKIHHKYHRKIGIIPNIFPTAKDDFLGAPADKNRLLFVGSLDYFPNTEGLKWFFNDIWPDVKKKYPHLKFTVIGRINGSSNSLYTLFGNPKDVDITVNVPSVYLYYQNCFASITPLLNGSGTRLKILESIAYGRPVLTTKKGMEGLDFKDQKELFIFKDPASFINAYETLLNDDAYQQVTARSFQVLEENYSPKAFESNMKKNWECLQG